MYYPRSRNYNLVFGAPTGLGVDGSREATGSEDWSSKLIPGSIFQIYFAFLCFLLLFYFVFIVILFYLFYDGYIGIGGLPLHLRLRSHAIS